MHVHKTYVRHTHINKVLEWLLSQLTLLLAISGTFAILYLAIKRVIFSGIALAQIHHG